MKRVIAGLSAAALMAAAAITIADTRSEAIADRLQPVGELCMAGEECTGGSIEVAAAEPRDPSEIFQSRCASCHNTGVGGAPKQGDSAAWTSRLEDKGIETLYENAWNGINAMPPKGICMDCSEEELNATVDYMIEQST